MRNRMRKMMFGYKIKAMRKGCISYAQAMRKMMFGYKIKAMRKGCVSYAQENAQNDVLTNLTIQQRNSTATKKSCNSKLKVSTEYQCN